MKAFRSGLIAGCFVLVPGLALAQSLPGNQLQIFQPSPLSVLQSPTYTGTVTFPDSATWASTGLADSTSYTTASTAMFNLSPTWSFSSTASGIGPFIISPILIPTGASAGNDFGVSLNTTLGTSAVNFSNVKALNLALNTGAAYSGTATLGIGIHIRTPTVSGTNPFPTYDHILFDPITNGNGITTGTVTNNGLSVVATTAAAGAGGTVVNNAILIALPSSSSAGNTDSGIKITGNGGATSTKYAVQSTSTAPSAFGGPIITSGTIPTIGSGACGTGANGTLTAGSRTNSGQVNIGAAATTVCTVVFAVALPTTPFCVISASDAAAIGATALPYVSANTTAGFVITGSLLANASFNYVCL